MVRSALLGFALLPLVFQHAMGDEKAAIAEIEKLGGTVRTIAANDDSKDVDFHLSGTELTDAGMANVAQVQKLVWLNLKDTKITDAGLQQLAGLTGLTRLHLERTAVSDAGLAHLKGLANLQYLNLYGTKVTDAGLDHLAGLKSLKRLYLWQTEVTAPGADKLAKALPDEDAIGSVAAYVSSLPPASSSPVVAGDADRGRNKFASCIACHGINGRGMESLNAPALAGLDDWYVARQLQNFRDGVRGYDSTDAAGQQMRGAIGVLGDDDDIRDVAAYIATLP